MTTANEALRAEDRALAIQRALAIAEQAPKNALGCQVGRAGFCEVAMAALQTAADIADAGDNP